MGNRILKESICTSENVDSLSAFHETFFYRLIVNCDDFGRMDARPKILASRLFPLKDLRINQIEDALRALTSAELVTLYEVNGKPFLQMKTWDRHQQIRAKKSKYPSPDEGIGYQLISDDIKCPRNPIQNESESESESESKKETAQARQARFDRFWAAYPRKEAKPRALAEFTKLNPDDDLLARMLSAVERWRRSAQWQEENGKFIPHPATWIHQKRWEDEPPKNQQYEQRDYSAPEDDSARIMQILQGDMRA